jgi:NitT/TauT family transport system ATP-binding protein
MNGIHVDSICKKIRIPDGKVEPLFEKFSLTVDDGEVVGIFGPNGCGKTTLLNMISGIVEPDSGHITIKEKKPKKKNISYIFQDYRSSLFPWLSIRDNILFPLVIRKRDKASMTGKLSWLLDLVKIPFSLERYPYQLSGGQQQYAAIMRGLISDPDVMLMDEPFSALDYSNGMWLMEKMAGIQDKIMIPTLIVAHDLDHLMYLTKRIVFLSEKPARILQEKTVHHDHTVNKSAINCDYADKVKNELESFHSGKKFDSMWWGGI